MHANGGFGDHDDLDNSSAPVLGTYSALSNSNRLKRLMSLVKVLIFPPLIIFTFNERIPVSIPSKNHFFHLANLIDI